jgi:hypothetical protein
MPLPWKQSVADEHFLAFANVRRLQELSRVDTDERFMPSACNKNAKTSTQGLAIDMKVKEREGMNKLWTQEAAIMYSKCHLCCKPRVVYSLEKANKQQMIAQVEMYLNVLPLQCGMPLFAMNSETLDPIYRKVFVRQSVTCGQQIQQHYYANRNLFEAPDVCIYCGTPEDICPKNERLEDGRQVRPQCNQCVSDGLDRFPWGKKRSTQELSLSQRPKQKRGKVKNSNDSGKTCSDAEMSEAENRGEESEIKIIETRLTEKQHVSENPGNDRSCCCGDICFVGENTRTMAVTVRCSVCHFYCHEECSVSNPSGEDSGDEAYMQIMCDLCSKKTKCSAV